MGVDMALTTTTGGALGLDADGSEWTFESKLTNYAEYPSSDGGSRSARHHLERGVPCSVTGLEGGPWNAMGSSSSQIQKLGATRRRVRKKLNCVPGVASAGRTSRQLIASWPLPTAGLR